MPTCSASGARPPQRGRGGGARASLDVGDAKAYASIADMVADPAIDAIWLAGPNHGALENIEEIVDADRARPAGRSAASPARSRWRGTSPRPSASSALVKRAGLEHGYLENQVFAPQVEAGRALLWARGAATTGRPYLARAAEEHSGPHTPWFWRGDLQGGGVLNDMMCHSALVVRHLLTKPGAPRASVRPVRVTAHIASLKWTRPEYAQTLKANAWQGGRLRDGSPRRISPASTIEFETDDGYTVIGEATTSWSFVGAGLRLSAELLGPEYSMSWNTLDSGLKLFFSPRSAGQGRRGPGREAERRDRADAGRGERGGRLRLRGRGPALRRARSSARRSRG